MTTSIKNIDIFFLTSVERGRNCLEDFLGARAERGLFDLDDIFFTKFFFKLNQVIKLKA